MDKIKKGYKKTKVGIIPKEWEVVRLGEVFDFIKTYSNSRNHLSNIGDIEYIHYGDIHTKYKFHIDFNKIKLPKISKDKIKGEINYVKNGDLILADASEDYADIGKSIEIINLSKNRKVISGLHTFLLRDKRNYFVNGYKGLILYNYEVSKSIKKIATGISVLGISKTNLKNLYIPLPPLPEQKKIAKILTTWDRAIEKLKALIREKERLKKGLMQRLLSGKVRFNEFKEEWNEVRLGEVANIYKGKQINKSLLKKKCIFPVINGGIEASGYTDNFNTSENTITISEGGNSCGFVNLITKKFWSGGHCYTLKEVKIDNNFLYQILKFNESKIMKLRVGSGLPNIQKKDINNFKILKPPLPEQQKIAKLLTIADKEIELLKRELKALEEQKKGLMQKLLTGEIKTNNIKEIE